jgi:crotonobetainyl-CoA:carnitine CoA-transferase CaiB-like acyl-CoA transferase
MLLGDMGAEVIKIETPGKGDPLRAQGVIKNGLSWYYASFNRNKKSMTLNMRTPEGKDILSRLIRRSDVVVDNYRPGVMTKMGFDYETLKKINPEIIHCGISGFGVDGPAAGRPAFDFIAQAMSGLMSINGSEQSGPMRVSLPISDLVAGLYAAFGIVCSLTRRLRSGQGEQVQTSLVDGLISFMAYMSANFLASGEIPQRTGNDHPIVAPYGLFRARDGEVAIAPSNDAFYEKFIEALDLTHLRDDPRFATNDLRMKNREAINQIVEEKIKTQPKAYWVEKLNHAGVPTGVIQNMKEVFEDPQVLHQKMVIDVEQSDFGSTRMTGFPVKLREKSCQLNLPAPKLGEHTVEILTELGVSENDIASYKNKQII